MRRRGLTINRWVTSPSSSATQTFLGSLSLGLTLSRTPWLHGYDHDVLLLGFFVLLHSFTLTLSYRTLPAAVIWPLRNRGRWFAASTTALYPEMFDMELNTSMDWARVMRGTWSKASAVACRVTSNGRGRKVIGQCITFIFRISWTGNSLQRTRQPPPIPARCLHMYACTLFTSSSMPTSFN